jgi:hypothetical protein
MNRQDSFALLYAQACLSEMRRDPGRVLGIAKRNLALLTANGIGHQSYVNRWRSLLE